MVGSSSSSSSSSSLSIFYEKRGCRKEKKQGDTYEHIHTRQDIYLFVGHICFLLSSLFFPPLPEFLLSRNPRAGTDAAALTWCGKCCRCCCCSCCCSSLFFVCFCLSIVSSSAHRDTLPMCLPLPFISFLLLSRLLSSFFLYIFTHVSPPRAHPSSSSSSSYLTLFGPAPTLLTPGQTSLASYN